MAKNEVVKSNREWPRPATLLPPSSGQSLAQYQSYVAAYKLYVEELNRQREAYFAQKKQRLAARPKPQSKDQWLEKHLDQIKKRVPTIPKEVEVIKRDFIPGKKPTPYIPGGSRPPVQATPGTPDKWVERKEKQIVNTVDENQVKQIADSTWSQVVSKRNRKKEKRREKAVQGSPSRSNEEGKVARLIAKAAKPSVRQDNKNELQGHERNKVLKKLRHLSKAPPSEAFIKRAFSAMNVPQVAGLSQPERSRLLLANREKIENEVHNSVAYRDFVKKYRETLTQSLLGQRNADRLIEKRLKEVTAQRVESAVREAYFGHKRFDDKL